MTILLAGATGVLGGRIARELRLRHADVKATVRRGTTPDKVARLEALGVTVVELDPDSLSEVTAACRGASCVVSALNGLEPVIMDTQGVLLRSAVAAGVPRFIPSDFSLDFTKTEPGGNRNLDLRRDFHKLLDAAPIQATSILNGGFMELLAGQAPFLLFKPRRVLYFGDADQRIDFTTMDDVAAFTAEAALDPSTPRVLRIAGDQVSARDLAAIAGKVTGRPFKTLRAGGLGALATVIRLLRAIAPGRRSIFPPWQGMQYMHDMFSGQGKLAPIDNDRYPGLRWTSARVAIQTSSHEAAVSAALHGGGLACLARFRADRESGLTRLVAPGAVPDSGLWLVTHKDNRRNARIRATLTHITNMVRGVAAQLKPDDSPTDEPDTSRLP